MSLAQIRDGPLSARRSDRAASLRKRSSKLRALNAITATITQHCGLAPSLETNFDAIPSPPLTPSETRLLDANDLEKGHYFQDSTFSVTLEAIQAICPFKAAHSPSERLVNGHHSSIQVLGEAASATTAPVVGATNEAKPFSDLSQGLQADGQPAQVEPARADCGPIRPSDVARQHPDHPKTVHLPPKEVQEERLRARRQSRDEFRAAQLREAEANPVDTNSSPSSTTGAWSNATPMPADPSPVTSLGEEVPVPAEPPEQKSRNDQSMHDNESAQKIHHDDLLDAQKDLARREILGPDMDSPDVQLRHEQEQAVKASRDAAASAPLPVVAAPLPPTEQTSSHSNGTEEAAKGEFVPDQHTRPSHVATPTVDAVVKTEPSQEAPTKDLASSSCANLPVAQSNATLIPRNRKDALVEVSTLRQDSASVTKGDAQVLPRASAERSSNQASLRSPKSSAVDVPVIRQHRTAQADVAQSTGQAKQRNHNPPANCRGYEAMRGAAEDPAKDYLEPLFKMQTYDNLPINKTLSELLQRASKVVSTSDQFAGIHERQDHKILRRIYSLQNANKWSLRQMQPLPEPAAPKTHMDYLLAEMKWMRTDFRQERKEKKFVAKLMADACAAWVVADAEERRNLQIRLKVMAPIKVASNALHSPAETNVEHGEQLSQGARSPPELESGNEQDDSSFEDLDLPGTPTYVLPRSLDLTMNLNDDGFLRTGKLTDEFAEVMSQLPLYTPFNDEPVPALTQRAVPQVSKFCEGKIMTQIPITSRKRSRFQYASEDEEDVEIPAAKRPRAKEGAGLRPEQIDVALFDPENKLLRDRLHSNTAFRPPSEFPMPSSQFYEFRTGSQWIAEDEQLLRRLAKDYSFNWSLIADEMSLPSTMSSSADRRTPWECFERWVDLESLPNEMRKTLYFKTWNQRIDAAQRNNEHRYQAQLQAQAQTPNQPQNIVRRRTTPIRVEKRRTNRYLHVVDAMRKNARKREQHAHKQAEAQKAASLRKQHESTAPKSAMHSPAEFSRLRHERDVAYAQRQEQYRQQMVERQRQAALQQRNGQYAGQQGQAHPSANQQRPAQQVQPAQPQVHPQMHPPQQGQVPRSNPAANLAVPQMGMQGNIPQAQMQPNMRGGPNVTSAATHGTSDNSQQVMALENARRQAQMKQQQQAQLNGQQFQMGPPNRASPGGIPSANGMMNGQANSAMMTAMQQSSNSHGTVSNGNSMPTNYNGPSNNTASSASPHMPPPPTPAGQQSQQQQPQQLSSGHIPAIAAITHSLQAKNPNATPDQIKEMTSQHLKQFYSTQQNHQARQSAMQAAAGTHNVTPTPTNQAAYNQTQNQAAYQQNNTNAHGNNSNIAANVNGQQPTYPSTPNANGVSPTPNIQSQYSAQMRSQLNQQMIQQRQNQIQSAAIANGSPHLTHASPNLAHASPNMAQAVPNMNGVASANRTPTPQMARLGSSGGQQGQTPLRSPGLTQNSPRAVPAGVAQRQ